MHYAVLMSVMCCQKAVIYTRASEFHNLLAPWYLLKTSQFQTLKSIPMKIISAPFMPAKPTILQMYGFDGKLTSFLPSLLPILRCLPYVSQHGLYLHSKQTPPYKLAITVCLMLLLFIISYSNTHSTTGGKEYSLVIKVMKYSFMLPFQQLHKWASHA